MSHKSLQKSSSLNLDIHALDSLPKLMKKMKSSPASPGRFKAFGTNSSFDINVIMRAHQPQFNASSKEDTCVKKRMTQQAEKIMKQLAADGQLDIDKKGPESLAEQAKEVRERIERVISKTRKESLDNLSSTGAVLDKIYSQYDKHRRGKIAYDDFRQSLVASDSQTHHFDYVDAVVEGLDPKKTGEIDYKNIIGLLKKVEKTQIQKLEEEKEKVKNSEPVENLATSEAETFFPKSVELTSVSREMVPEMALETNTSILYSAYPNIMTEKVQRRFAHNHIFNKLEAPYYTEKKKERSSSTPAGRRKGDSVRPLSNFSTEDTAESNGVDDSCRRKTKTLKDHCETVENSNNSTRESEKRQNKLDGMGKRPPAHKEKINIIENNVCVQLGSRFNALRHILKQSDISNSGSVNYPEFETALYKTGIHVTKQQYRQLFEENCQQVSSKTAIGLTEGKTLSIDKFLSKLHSRVTSSAFSHLAQENKSDLARDSEESRVFKKVVDATGSERQTVHLFRSLDVKNKGWINPSELKDGLNSLGSNLNDIEFSLLLSKIDKNSDGKIELKEFDNALHREFNEKERNKIIDKFNSLSNHKRYSNSYRSCEALHYHDQDVSEKMSDHRDHKKESLQWAKLEKLFQEKKEDVLKLFGLAVTGAKNSDAIAVASSAVATLSNEETFAGVGVDLRTVPTAQLQPLLQQAGINLGEDDIKRLHRRINTHVFGKDEEKIVLNEHAKKETSVDHGKKFTLPWDFEKERGRITEITHPVHHSTEVLRDRVMQSSSPKCDRQRAVQADAQNSRLSLGDFCRLMGIPLSERTTKGSNPKLEVVACDRSTVPYDGGTFVASRYSQLSHSTYSTTFHLEAVDQTSITGVRKKKMAQHMDRSSDPSKFWQLEHGRSGIEPSIASYKDENPSRGRGREQSSRGHRSSSAPAPVTSTRDGSGRETRAQEPLNRWATQTLSDFAVENKLSVSSPKERPVSALQTSLPTPTPQLGNRFASAFSARNSNTAWRLNMGDGPRFQIAGGGDGNNSTVTRALKQHRPESRGNSPSPAPFATDY